MIMSVRMVSNESVSFQEREYNRPRWQLPLLGSCENRLEIPARLEKEDHPVSKS